MHRVADDVFHIPLMPRDAVNAYLVGDVIVDAGIPRSAKKVLDAVKGLYVRAHAVTHAHQDHVGGSKAGGRRAWRARMGAPSATRRRSSPGSR